MAAPSPCLSLPAIPGRSSASPASGSPALGSLPPSSPASSPPSPAAPSPPASPPSSSSPASPRSSPASAASPSSTSPMPAMGGGRVMSRSRSPQPPAPQPMIMTCIQRALPDMIFISTSRRWRRQVKIRVHRTKKSSRPSGRARAISRRGSFHHPSGGERSPLRRSRGVGRPRVGSAAFRATLAACRWPRRCPASSRRSTTRAT